MVIAGQIPTSQRIRLHPLSRSGWRLLPKMLPSSITTSCSTPSSWSFRRSPCSLVSFPPAEPLLTNRRAPEPHNCQTGLRAVHFRSIIPGDLDRERSSRIGSPEKSIANKMFFTVILVSCLNCFHGPPRCIPINTAKEGPLAVTAITYERDSSHIVIQAALLG